MKHMFSVEKMNQIDHQAMEMKHINCEIEIVKQGLENSVSHDEMENMKKYMD